MGFVINLKAETGLVDRTLNTNRFYKDIKNYKPFTNLSIRTKKLSGSPSLKKLKRT